MSKIGPWWVARLKFTISLGNFNLGGRSCISSIFGPLGFGSSSAWGPKSHPTRNTPDTKQRHLWGDFQLQQLSRWRAADIAACCSNNVVSCGVWFHRGFVLLCSFHEFWVIFLRKLRQNLAISNLRFENAAMIGFAIAIFGDGPVYVLSSQRTLLYKNSTESKFTTERKIATAVAKQYGECSEMFFPKENHWEIKGRFRKRVVLANVPSFRFSFRGNIR